MSLFWEKAALLFLAINGVCFIVTDTAPTTSPSDLANAHVESITHPESDCAPSRLAMYNNSHDIACVLGEFEMITSDFKLNECTRIVYGDNNFADQYRALIETISLFETTNLAVQNFNESLCRLKTIVLPGLNHTVRSYCNCRECSPHNVAASTPTPVSEGADERCLLINLELTLKDIMSELGEDHVTCRRASVTQQQVLLNFKTAVNDYNDVVNPLSVIRDRLPMDPCYYGDDNLDTAVKSLHALTPYLNNSASTEAQHLSGNISAAIFPVVGQLLGENRVEELVNNSTPFSQMAEVSFQALTEEKKTRCLIQRLDLIYKDFIGALSRGLYINSDTCTQASR